jgi:hypothetical protein
MSPSSFTFKLTVPNDPEGATVAAVVATHAVDYANIEAAAGQAFVDRVRQTALQALQARDGTHCQIVVAAADGHLTFTIGSQAVTEPLPA